MHYLRFTIIILFLPYMLVSQNCLPGGIVFTSQSEVDAFPANYPGCSVVEGGITLSNNSNISNLDSLIQIIEIEGALSILNCDSLTSLEGLNNISIIGDSLYLFDNDGLIDLIGFNNLSIIEGNLRFHNNDELLSFTGINKLKEVKGNVVIHENNPIVNFIGFNQLELIDGNFEVLINDALINFEGLENLVCILGDFRISGNQHLVNFSGLYNLSKIGGDLEIYDNNQLSQVDALISLNSNNGEVLIAENNQLVNIYGLGHIDHTTITHLTIQNNSNLGLCAVPSVCNYLLIPTNPSVISGNSTGCNTRLQIESECTALPVVIEYFNASIWENIVLVDWKSSFEQNCEYYEVQRSTNVLDWKTIQKVEGVLFSYTPVDYQITDKAPLTGTNYYRLVQTDLNGIKHIYHKIVSVEITRPFEILIQPNPFSDYIMIWQPNSDFDDLQVIVFDLQGRIVFEGDIHDTDSEVALQFLPPGQYHLLISSGQNIRSFKVIKR